MCHTAFQSPERLLCCRAQYKVVTTTAEVSFQSQPCLLLSKMCNERCPCRLHQHHRTALSMHLQAKILDVLTKHGSNFVGAK